MNEQEKALVTADTLIIRVNRNARELASLIDRDGGLLFGMMPPEEAFDYLHEAERLVAEARAAAQEGGYIELDPSRSRLGIDKRDRRRR